MTARAPSALSASARAGLLRDRDVRVLLAGQAISELGSQVGSIALPLVAVLGLGASPLQVGMLTAAGAISFAVLADAASFLVSAWCLLAIKVREPRPARPARPALRRELAEGSGSSSAGPSSAPSPPAPP